MDYTEILHAQAKLMAKQLADLTGEDAFKDPRLADTMHKAFCIIRNDTNTLTIADMLIGKEIANLTPAKQRAIREFVVKYAAVNQIKIPAVMSSNHAA
jgi:hypothetical protein